MKHYLTYQDDKSNKFWRIETSGKSFTVTFGKIGTTGTSHTKAFKSDRECILQAEKLLAEKLKKGYNHSSLQDQKVTTKISGKEMGVGALLLKKIRYQMQDSDTIDRYLFTVTHDNDMKVHFVNAHDSKGLLVFKQESIESATCHVDFIQGHVRGPLASDLPDEIISELPPFLLSRKTFLEIRDKGKSKFALQWCPSITHDSSSQKTRITLRSRQTIKIVVDGEDVSVPLLICKGRNSDSDAITLWIVDDEVWPIIFLYDFGGEFFWKFLEAGKDLKPRTFLKDNFFDFTPFGFFPPDFEDEVEKIISASKTRSRWPAMLEKWKPIAAQFPDFTDYFDDFLDSACSDLESRIQGTDEDEDVKVQLNNILDFFGQLLGKSVRDRFEGLSKSLEESQLKRNFDAAIQSEDYAILKAVYKRLPFMQTEEYKYHILANTFEVSHQLLVTNRLAEVTDIIKALKTSYSKALKSK